MAQRTYEALRRPHSDRCTVELDPERYGPCMYGASAHNVHVDVVLEELAL